MSVRIAAKRKFRMETLELRQLLHGGAFAGGEPPSTAERVESAFQRLDENDDSILTQDEVSERTWERLSAADTDDVAGISPDELIAYVDAQALERSEDGERPTHRGRHGGRGGPGGRFGGGQPASLEERIDSLIAEHDVNEDGLLTADEVSERVWERLAEADANGDGVSKDEMLALAEVRQQERLDAAFARLDDSEDGSVTEDEVSERAWERLSQADTSEDGAVSKQEFEDYIAAKRAEMEAGNDGGDDTVGEATVDAESMATSRFGGTRAGRGFRLRR